MIRNITFTESGTGDSPAATPAPVIENVTLRLRKVTMSPLEEYQARPGQVAPISDELAAAILSFKGRATVSNKGVVVDRKDIGGKYIYFHENSIVLNDFASRERRLYYVINRQIPEVLHLLDETGCYLESLPLRERPAVLDNEAQAKQLRENKAIATRAATRLQQLHGEDTREALKDLAENAREMQRIVHTMPSPCTDPAPSPQPSRNGSAERIAHVNAQTSERVTREKSAGSPADIVARRTRQATCPF